MNFEIISIGDGAFLTQIFRFLAFLNSPGNNYYSHLGMIGGLLGIMMIAYSAVDSSGRQFPVGRLAVSFVMFVVFFGNTAQVQIEDYYTGQTQVVDNVPWGSAAIGYGISTLGVNLGEAFETATSLPGVDDGGLPPQYVLNAFLSLRQLTDNQACANGSSLCGLSMSTEKYVQDCYLPAVAINNGQPPHGDVRSAADAITALANQSTVRMTMFYPTVSSSSSSSASAPQQVSCQTAYTQLQTAFADPTTATALCKVYSTAVAATFTLPGQATSSSSAPQFANCSGGSSSMLSSAYSTIGQGSLDAQATMRNAFLMNIYNQALADGGKIDTTTVQSAALMETAIQQRNANAAGQSSIWLRCIRAILTFFEGFAYGIAPFLALVMPIPGLGMKMFGRYLSLLLWIFTWTPIMSFITLYQVMAVTGRMDALMNSRPDVPIASMFGINQIQMAAADWIATSSYLTPSVVGLSGFLIFGGIAAFSSMANSVGGGEHVAGEMIAPPIASTGSVVQTAPGAENSLLGGPLMAHQPLHSYTHNDAAALSMSAVHSAMESKVANVLAGFSSTGTSTLGHKVTDSVGSGNQHTFNASTSETHGAAHKSGDTSTDQHGTAQASQSSHAEGANAKEQITVGASLAGSGASAQAARDSGDRASATATDTSQHTGASSEGAEISHAKTAALAESLVSGTQDAHTVANEMGLTSAQASTLSRTVAEARTEMDNYAQASSHNQGLSDNVTRTDAEIATSVVAHGMGGSVVGAATSLDGSGYHSRLEDMRSSGAFGAQSDAELSSMAAVNTLHDIAGDTTGRYSDQQRAEAATAFESAFGVSTGMSPSQLGGSFAEPGVSAGAAAVEHGFGEVSRGLDPTAAEAIGGVGHAPVSQADGLGAFGASHDRAGAGSSGHDGAGNLEIGRPAFGTGGQGHSVGDGGESHASETHSADSQGGQGTHDPHEAPEKLREFFADGANAAGGFGIEQQAGVDDRGAARTVDHMLGGAAIDKANVTQFDSIMGEGASSTPVPSVPGWNLGVASPFVHASEVTQDRDMSMYYALRSSTADNARAMQFTPERMDALRGSLVSRYGDSSVKLVEHMAANQQDMTDPARFSQQMKAVSETRRDFSGMMDVVSDQDLAKLTSPAVKAEIQGLVDAKNHHLIPH
ncbi:MAG: conjugal transfer protein TraG N-terminal domain-containing protein [Rhodanobacter sp.]